MRCEPYGARWSSLTLDHQTPVDEGLTHQVIFQVRQNNMQVMVTCNCRAQRKATGAWEHPPMGPSNDLATARALYNDPANHVVGFTEEDRARW